MSKKILLVSNTAWSIHNFRTGLLKSLLKQGYKVAVLAPSDDYVSFIKKLGCEYFDIKMNNKGLNPFGELILVGRFYSKIKLINPDIILSFTIKPNLYGSFVARFLRIPILINITGLGEGFSRGILLKKGLMAISKICFKKANTAFFQNIDDYNFFVENTLVEKRVAGLLPGSGVNVDVFLPMEKKQPNGLLKFCLLSRLLWDKGIEEYIEGAKLILEKHENVKFYILGKIDSKNNKAVPKSYIEDWQSSGLIEYLGFSDNVWQHIREMDCIVLPSYYREGTPRSLIEAIAMGKPVITTNHIGCKEVVDDGINGYLCEIKNIDSLFKALDRFISLSENQRKNMGEESRKKAVSSFDEKLVISKYHERIEMIQ